MQIVILNRTMIGKDGSIEYWILLLWIVNDILALYANARNIHRIMLLQSI